MAEHPAQDQIIGRIGRDRTVEVIAVSYGRVSKADKRLQRSVPEQTAANREVCEMESWQLGAEFNEPVPLSASRFATRARKAWSDLLDYLRTEPVDVLILWEPSRGDRTMGGWVELLDLCRDRGILMHITSHGKTYDPRQGRDRRSLLEDGTDSEYESEKTSARVKRAILANKKAGLPHGPTPYGYVREYRVLSGGRTEFVSQSEKLPEAEIVREIYRRFASGDNLVKIAVALTAKDHPVPGSGEVWTSKKVRGILRNPAYIAMSTHYGKMSRTEHWPAIVSDDVWQTCQDRLDDPKRRTQRGTEVQHLLSGIAECGKCGDKLYVRRPSADRAQYFCVKKGCLSTSQTPLEKYVTERIKARLFTLRSRPAPGTEQDARAKLADRRDTLRDQLAEVKEQLRQGRPIRTLAEFATEIEDELADVESQLRKPSVAPVVRVMVASPESFEGRDLMEQRELVRNMVRVVVNPTGRGSRKHVSERVTLSDPTTGQIWPSDDDAPDLEEDTDTPILQATKVE